MAKDRRRTKILVGKGWPGRIFTADQKIQTLPAGAFYILLHPVKHMHYCVSLENSLWLPELLSLVFFLEANAYLALPFCILP